MFFRFFVVIEKYLLVFSSPSISSLVFPVVPMQESISLNYYKTMLVDEKKTRITSIYFILLAFYSIIIAVFFEAIAVSWLYGIKRINEDVKEMLGTKPGLFWIVTWCVAAPLFLGVSDDHIWAIVSFRWDLQGIVLSGLIQHVAPQYGKETDPFYYEVWMFIRFLIEFNLRLLSVSCMESFPWLDICLVIDYLHSRSSNLSNLNRTRKFTDGKRFVREFSSYDHLIWIEISFGNYSMERTTKKSQSWYCN